MLDLRLYETIFDNLIDGVYVLDAHGNYIFVNKTYSQLLNMSKSFLLAYNVHDFVKSGQIDFCISDLVYEKKRRIVMYQDVQMRDGSTFRQLVISTPIFDEFGEVSNIIALVRPVSQISELQRAEERDRSGLRFSNVPSIRPQEHPEDIIASSPSMLQVLNVAAMVAQVDSSVLLTGESGTGKEVVAKYLYQQSRRKEKPYVVINCSAVPENLLESELFGYERGAFTGASSKGKRGLMEEAHQGTLFLDEINSLPPRLQGKLLRALENKTIQRLGSNRNIHVDFRLITATNVHLPELVQNKEFRADLFYRINVVPIHIPPLREREEDIIPLTLYFLRMFCEKYSKRKTFSEKTLELIRTYSWPGNVRELRNLVEHAVVMSLGDIIEISNIEQFIQGNVSNFVFGAQESVTSKSGARTDLPEIHLSLQDYLAQCEKQYVEAVLNQVGSTYKAAEILGTSQSSVMRKKKKYQI